MQTFQKSLILKIGTVVLIVEFLVLTSLGLFYTELFSHRLDQYLENAVNLPGELMNRQLLRYETVADHDVMTELVGEEFLDGMIVGADQRVYYAFNSELVGKSIEDIPGIDPTFFTQTTTQRIIRGSSQEEHSIVSVTPLVAFEGAKPFFHVYVKVGTHDSITLKRHITMLFILGSAICIILTSLAIIGYTRRHVTAPLGELTQSAIALQSGQLDADISIQREDEIGSLAKSFKAMRDSIAQKISELEKANASVTKREQQLNAFIAAMPDILFVLDKDGRYQEIYSPQDNLLFADIAELKGQLLHDAVPKDKADLFLTTIRHTLETGQVQSLEYELPVQKGKCWFEARVSRVGSDVDHEEVIWLSRDITYRKQIEERLRLSKETTERANRRLTELDQAKSALVSSVSHELRTPLTSLLGFSKLILKNFSKNFWPLAKNDHKLLTKGSQIVENLNILIHEGDRLTRLINDVLDLNKIEMGYTEWREEKINPSQLVKRAADAVSGQFSAHPDLTLITEVANDLPTIIVDGDKMLQVLLNLLTNAAKFTAHGTVNLRAFSPTDEVIRFEVVDTGPGINEIEQERIFERFHQAGHIDPSGDKPQGAGLGLAICREIVAHHGGSIWAESTVGHGSTFIIELPV